MYICTTTKTVVLKVEFKGVLAGVYSFQKEKKTFHLHDEMLKLCLEQVS